MLAVVSRKDRKKANLLENIFLIANNYTPEHLIATKLYVVSNQKKENSFPSLWTLWETDVFMDEEMYDNFLASIESERPKIIVIDYEGLNDTFSEALTFETIKVLADKYSSTLFYIILPKEVKED